jgi:glutaredoxin 3
MNDVPNIEIYTKTFCPYCIRAKHVLDSKGIEYQEHMVDLGGPTHSEMIQRADGRTSVPQIFIDDRHIGGCDELIALDRDGRLDEMLAA